eukprot:403339838
MYDNVAMPKRLTFILLLILAIFTGLHGTMSPETFDYKSYQNSLKNQTANNQQNGSPLSSSHSTSPHANQLQGEDNAVTQETDTAPHYGFSFEDSQNIIFEMASVRILIACMVILYNWFPMSYRGFIVGIWSSSYMICPIFYDFVDIGAQDYYSTECYVLAGLYFILSIVCYFYFYHNPSHIGVLVETNGGHNSGFFIEDYSSKIKNSDFTAQIKQFHRKHRISIIDAYQYKSVNFFILSFVLKKLHEYAIWRQGSVQKDYYYFYLQQTTYYSFGQIISIVSVAFLSDSVLKNKLYLTLTFISGLQILYIIIGYFADDWITQDESVQIAMAIFVGGILGSSNFLYSCLIPLKLARAITDRNMRRQLNSSNIEMRTSYVGTIIGVILGTTYLINTLAFTNMTALIDFIVANQSVAVTFLIMLLVISNLILYRGIKKELMSFQCMKRRFPKQIKSRNIYMETEGSIT